MNRNQMIGTVIGTVLGYACQGVMYSKIAKLTNIRSAVLIKIFIKYLVKLIMYSSKSYVRTDFRSDTIFSDAVDASFFAD